MENMYHSLEFTKIVDNTALYQPSHMKVSSVMLDDPAIIVMTDFKRILPLGIESTASIVAANEKMITCGVRLLFVEDDNGAISGLITADDILGRRPLNYMREHGGNREDILVLDVMTKKQNLESVSIDDIARYKVGDIVETLKSSARHHVLVTEVKNGNMNVRGMISRTQVSNQLGEKIRPDHRANTFAELETALVANG